MHRWTLFITAAVMAGDAERHGACVTPRSGCHEVPKVRAVGRITDAAPMCLWQYRQGA